MNATTAGTIISLHSFTPSPPFLWFCGLQPHCFLLIWLQTNYSIHTYGCQPLFGKYFLFFSRQYWLTTIFVYGIILIHQERRNIVATINDRILALREHLGLSRKAFGEKIGASDSVIKNIDYNVTEPKPLLIQQICKVYNVDPYWMETGEGDMFLAKDDMTTLMEFAVQMFKDKDLAWIRRVCEYINALTPAERAEVSRYIKGIAGAVLGDTEKEQE